MAKKNETPTTTTPEVEKVETEAEVVEQVSSAREQLLDAQTKFAELSKKLKADIKSESKTGAIEAVDAQSKRVVADLIAEVSANGMRLNNFTIRYKLGQTPDEIKTIVAVVRMTSEELTAYKATQDAIDPVEVANAAVTSAEVTLAEAQAELLVVTTAAAEAVQIAADEAKVRVAQEDAKANA